MMRKARNRRRQSLKSAPAGLTNGMRTTPTAWSRFDFEVCSRPSTSNMPNIRPKTTGAYSAGVLLTPRTRYERIARSVAEIPAPQLSRKYSISSISLNENRRRRQIDQHLNRSQSMGALGIDDDGNTLGSLNISMIKTMSQNSHTRSALLKSQISELQRNALTHWGESKKQREPEEKIERPRQRLIPAEHQPGVRKSTAALGVENLYNYYRNDAQELAALQQRVAKRKAKKTFSRYNFIRRNKKLLALHTPQQRKAYRSALKKKRVQRQAEVEQRVEKMASAFEQRQAQKQTEMIERIAFFQQRVQRDKARFTRHKNFQRFWLGLISLGSRMIWLNVTLRNLMRNRVITQTNNWLRPIIYHNYREALTLRISVTRTRALRIVTRCLIGWVVRWRYKRRRRICSELYEFLRICKTMSDIRQSIRGSSYRSKILLLQKWWRETRAKWEGQRLMLELLWNDREKIMTGARRYRGGNDSKKGPVEAMGVVLPGGGQKRLPLKKKRMVISKYLYTRRIKFNRLLKKWKIELDEFNEVNKNALEEQKARLRLGMDDHPMAEALKPPKRPRLPILPSNEEMDNIIKKATKQWMMNSLNKNMDKSDGNSRDDDDDDR